MIHVVIISIMIHVIREAGAKTAVEVSANTSGRGSSATIVKRSRTRLQGEKKGKKGQRRNEKGKGRCVA